MKVFSLSETNRLETLITESEVNRLEILITESEVID